MTVWRKGKAPSLLHWPPGRRPETEERARLRSARRRIAARFRGIAAQAPRPAVSMRRPPTRGPLDPWTPRKIALRGYFFTCIRAGPPLTGRRTRCISMALTPRHCGRCGRSRTLPRRSRCQNRLAGFPAPRTPPGTLTPRPAAHVAFLFIGLAGLLAAVSPRAPPHPPPAARAAKIGWRACRRPAPHGQPRTPPRRQKNAALSRRVLLYMLPAAGMRRGVIRFAPSLSWRSGCGPSGCPGPSPAARRRG